jgi:F-type H+-transporting ATPase subunit a
MDINNNMLNKAKEKGYEELVEVEIAWWKSPTADMSITMALATMVIFLAHFLGITRNTAHYFKHYFTIW